MQYRLTVHQQRNLLPESEVVEGVANVVRLKVS